MKNDFLRPGERLDDLLIDGLKIIQDPGGFCFSLDAVLLAHFATVRRGVTAVDLGTGTGILGFLLLTRGAGRVTGLEISPRAAAMAARSVSLNGLEDRFIIREADFRQLKNILPAGGYGLAIANPPYRPVGGGLVSPRADVAAARHELTAKLADVAAAAKYLVKYRGRFAISHLPERLADILAAFRKAALEPKRLRFVHPRLTAPPYLVMVEGVRGGQPGLEVMPPLAVYDDNGGYSREILRYYPDGGEPPPGPGR